MKYNVGPWLRKRLDPDQEKKPATAKAKLTNGHGAGNGGGTPITRTLCRKVIGEELEKTKQMVGQASWKIGRFKSGRYKEAAKLFRDLIEAKKFPEFLTLPAYDWIAKNEKKIAA